MSWLYQILAAFLCSLGITSFLIPKILLISFRKQLFDYADERKVHTGIVPRLGGVAFTPAVVISVALLVGVNAVVNELDFGRFLNGSSQLALGLCALLLLYFEGVADDLIGVGYKAKFGFQFFCASLVVASGIWLNDLYGLLGIHALPAWVGYPLSVVVIVFVLNAVNLIDGIDGLASGLSAIATFFFGCLFAYQGEWIYATLAFTTLGTLLPFYYYNVFGRAQERRKIFMGDAGSQTIGLILGTLAIRLSQSDPTLLKSVPDPIVVAFSLLLVPVLDVLRVIIHRVRNGQNPFKPDMNHIHHKFLALGMSHHTTMCVILAIAAFFALLNIGLLNVVNANLILVIDVVLWTAMHIWLSQMIRRTKRLKQRLQEANQDA